MKKKSNEIKPGDRDASGRFRPGVSGNPGGRPAGADEIRELAQQYGPEALQRAVELMRSEDERLSLSACALVLDRAYGKPMQPAEVTGPPGSTPFVLSAPWWQEVVEARGRA